MISIDQKIEKLSDLSSRAQIILDWLPGMQSWLNKSLNDDSLNYSFESEAELLNESLYGLYSSHVFYLKNCDIWASPERYLALTKNELSIINDVFEGKTSTAGFTQLLSAERIYTTAELTEAFAFLQDLGVHDVQIFSSLSLDGRIKLLPIVRQFSDKGLDQASIDTAVTFAIGKSIDALSFGYMVDFGFTLVNWSNVVDTSIDLNKYYESFLPFVMEYLSCPSMGLLFSHEMVGDLINDWGKNETAIGFTDLPTAISQLSHHTYGVRPATQSALPTLIENFNNVYFKFLAQCQITKHQLSQDSSMWYYYAETSQYSAVFVLAEDGCLSLKCFNKASSQEKK